MTNITEAKAQLSRLIDEAAAGKRVVISRNGRPVAVLVAYGTDDTPRILGGWEGRVEVSEDFDDLDESVLAAFEGGDG